MTEVKCPSHHITSGVHVISHDSIVDVNFHHLVKIVLVRIPHHKVTIFPFLTLFLRNKSLTLAHPQGESVGGKRRSRIKLYLLLRSIYT